MAAKRSIFFYLTIALLIIGTLVQEAEARRKIVRGRKAITKTYYRGNAVPAWAVSVMVGVAMLIIGGVIYAIMRKVVLSDDSTQTRVTYTPAMTAEP